MKTESNDTSIALHTAFDPAGDFSSPSDALNQIFQQASPIRALLDLVTAQVALDECGFASEVVRDFGSFVAPELGNESDVASASGQMQEGKPGDNDDVLEVVAYMHATSDTCISADKNAYTNPRKLVFRDAAADRLEWNEKGLAEWRDLAMKGIELAKYLQAIKPNSEKSPEGLSTLLSVGQKMSQELAGYADI